MKRLIPFIFAVILFTFSLSSCGSPKDTPLTYEEKNNILAGITEDEIVDDALTIILCGETTSDIESAVSEFKKLKEIDVNVIKYDENNNGWDKFATKVMAQDDDYDLFMPVEYQIASIIRNGAYQDLRNYDGIKSRLESNALTNVVANLDNTLIGIPCSIELFYSGKVESAMTLFKYCYKNLNLFTGEYSDPNGDELFEVLKNRYANPEDIRENAYYDFDYHDANTKYLFMNRNSQRKELAVEFLCFLFDALNKDIEVPVYHTYPEVEPDVEYIPAWLFYSLEFTQPIANAVSSAADTDGSDETLRKLAETAAKQLRMRLEG